MNDDLYCSNFIEHSEVHMNKGLDLERWFKDQNDTGTTLNDDVRM